MFHKAKRSVKNRRTSKEISVEVSERKPVESMEVDRLTELEKITEIGRQGLSEEEADYL